jgi:hypothetical protein
MFKPASHLLPPYQPCLCPYQPCGTAVAAPCFVLLKIFSFRPAAHRSARSSSWIERAPDRSSFFSESILLSLLPARCSWLHLVQAPSARSGRTPFELRVFVPVLATRQIFRIRFFVSLLKCTGHWWCSLLMLFLLVAVFCSLERWTSTCPWLHMGFTHPATTCAGCVFCCLIR